MNAKKFTQKQLREMEIEAIKVENEWKRKINPFENIEIFQRVFSVEIFRPPIVKKNTQRVVGVGRGRRVIYSPRFLEWETEALLKLRSEWKDRPITKPLCAIFRFFLKDRSAEPDVSNLVEGIQDALKKAGVIEDDGLIQLAHIGKFPYEEPRTEVELYVFGGHA